MLAKSLKIHSPWNKSHGKDQGACGYPCVGVDDVDGIAYLCLLPKRCLLRKGVSQAAWAEGEYGILDVERRRAIGLAPQERLW
jgi:hypothetical protein